MRILQISEEMRKDFNKVVMHPLQSYEWGEFRKKTGIKIIRRGIYDGGELVSAFQLSIHSIPNTSLKIGYLPKSVFPTKEILEELANIGKKENCIFIQLEPNEQMVSDSASPTGENRQIDKLLNSSQYSLKQSAHPLFTKYTFQLDLTKTEEELLKNLHPKTRYNIKVAERHGVLVSVDNTDAAFEKYWALTQETTKRQRFYAHTKHYHKSQWETLNHVYSSSKTRISHTSQTINPDQLTSHLFTATYQNKVLTTMLFFVFHDTLYYPYGASSNENRNVMHSTLTMWEAIKWGKKLGLKKFDMWGSLSSNPDPNNPWYGFHLFKKRFNPEHIEYVGSLDLVIKPFFYEIYKIADILRSFYLKIKR